MYTGTASIHQFMHRQQQLSSTSVGVKKGAWTPEEDMLLKKCIEKHGEGKWHLVPRKAGLNRCRKSCRLRWLNYLKPNIKRGDFAEDEIDLMMRLHRLLGNRWSLIAGRIPGRTANDIKNYWNTHYKRNPCTTFLKRKKEPGDVRVTKETTNIIKPRPLTFSKALPSFMGNDVNVAAHVNNNITRTSNEGPLNNTMSPELIQSPVVLGEGIHEYWDSLFDDHEQEIGGQVGWSIGGVQEEEEEEAVLDEVGKEDGQDNWMDFSIDTNAWDLVNLDEPLVQ